MINVKDAIMTSPYASVSPNIMQISIHSPFFSKQDTVAGVAGLDLNMADMDILNEAGLQNLKVDYMIID